MKPEARSYYLRVLSSCRTEEHFVTWKYWVRNVDRPMYDFVWGPPCDRDMWSDYWIKQQRVYLERLNGTNPKKEQV